MNFIDKLEVKVIAGKGGNGKLSFRHVIYNAKGGPDGGDGGNGGNVVVKASFNQNTLSRYRYTKELKAKDGSSGSQNKRHGKNGSDYIASVPVGTVVSDLAGHVLADLVEDGQEVIIVNGGKGGFGNAHFISSRRQAPNFAEKGEPGESLEIIFELKMIADVGLAGLPNAGKSTFLATVSNARPEIADYPFTTLVPNLGVADIDENQSILIADIPGLIEGAASGKGLGHDFLRHIERTKLILHLIDSYNEDVAGAYKTIRHELEAYQAKLNKRPEIVALTKIDGIAKKDLEKKVSALKRVTKSPIYLISSLDKTGIKELLFDLNKKLKKVKPKKPPTPSSQLPVISLPNMHEMWHVRKHGGIYKVTGVKIEQFANRTDFLNDQALIRLKDIMRRQGIIHELKRRGIKDGQVVQIGENSDHSFTY